jgi:3-deoxy-7-phosphoheptulonate synthase
VVEVHNQPERALSDGPQALLPEMFERMVADVRAIHALVQRQDTESTRP